jgi:hypothetical protein
MHARRRLLLIAVVTVSATALVACGEKASDKQVDTLVGEGFTVAMPGSPKRQTQTVQTAAGPVVVTAYITEGGEEGFSMSVAKIPSTVKGDLDGAISGAAANVKGTLKDTVKTTYQGYPARDTRIINAQDKNGKKGTVFARVILAEGRLFQLQFIQEGGDVKSPPAAYPAFLRSLKIS